MGSARAYAADAPIAAALTGTRTARAVGAGRHVLAAMPLTALGYTGGGHVRAFGTERITLATVNRYMVKPPGGLQGRPSGGLVRGNYGVMVAEAMSARRLPRAVGEVNADGGRGSGQGAGHDPAYVPERLRSQ